MFIGIRDIRFAKGRFALICAVIAMMTAMVVALSALTAGLQSQSISAVTRLPGQTLVVQQPAGEAAPSLTQSTLDEQTVGRIVTENGANAAELGVMTTRLAHGASTSVSTVFGADTRLMPAATSGARPEPGGILLNAAQAEELGVGVGDSITVGSGALRVDGIGTAGDFAHTPVAYTTVDTWRELAHGQYASAIVLMAGSTDAPGTISMPMSAAVDAVPGYSSEHGSLLAMQAMLVAISALVVGAFFAVWTVQRLRDLAIVRAMGGSQAYLLRDGLGQAMLVLFVGEAIGTVLALVLAVAVSSVVPVSLSLSGIAVPVLAITVLGAIGALLAVRRVAVVDPLVAMSR